MSDIYDYMQAALNEAQLALEKGEIPVGAVIVKDNQIIARSHNLRETTKDPLAHAELLAMQKAAQALGDWRLIGCSLFVTLEPCAMCAGAIAQSRMEKVFFGAFDKDAGCVESAYPLLTLSQVFIPAVGGIMEKECQQLLLKGFDKMREKQK